MDLEKLITASPVLYHMAEETAWPLIQEKGLLSTSALLDLYKVQEPKRSQIEKAHRRQSIPVSAPGLPPALIRDQHPMDDASLEKCLPKDIKPAQWYAFLNGKVFFWTTRDRLHVMMGSSYYCAGLHMVLEVDTRSLIEAHGECVRLCGINSGLTKLRHSPVRRDFSRFERIEDYRREPRARGDEREYVAELTVEYSVPDITRHIRRVSLQRSCKTADGKKSSKIIEILKH